MIIRYLNEKIKKKRHGIVAPIEKKTIFAASNKERFFEKNCSADIAQLVEQLICNQPVVGSSPSIGSKAQRNMMGEFQSGQMGQTVNLLAKPSEVRILPLPLFAEVAHLAERQPSKL